MKIVRLLGGLGNQMFQFALFLRLKEEGYQVKIDVNQLEGYKLHNGYELEKIFGLKPDKADYNEVRKISLNRKNNFSTSILRKIFKANRYEFIERLPFTFDNSSLEINGTSYYQGYWQNEEYFLPIRNRVLTSFNFVKSLDKRNSILIEELKSCNSISIHIRRGDYLKDQRFATICNHSYYINAIAYLKEKISNAKFYFFSDDIDWCKENFEELNATFIDWNSGDDSYIDMQLMSCCKHNIIANSSFSWWGAWLNQNESKIVIGPRKWVGNRSSEAILPNNWVRI